MYGYWSRLHSYPHALLAEEVGERLTHCRLGVDEIQLCTPWGHWLTNRPASSPEGTARQTAGRG